MFQGLYVPLLWCSSAVSTLNLCCCSEYSFRNERHQIQCKENINASMSQQHAERSLYVIVNVTYVHYISRCWQFVDAAFSVVAAENWNKLAIDVQSTGSINIYVSTTMSFCCRPQSRAPCGFMAIYKSIYNNNSVLNTPKMMQSASVEKWHSPEQRNKIREVVRQRCWG